MKNMSPLPTEEMEAIRAEGNKGNTMTTTLQETITNFKHPYMSTDVELSKNDDGTYNVLYGFDRNECVSYEDAAKALGEYLMHSVTCAGLMDEA